MKNDIIVVGTDGLIGKFLEEEVKRDPFLRVITTTRRNSKKFVNSILHLDLKENLKKWKLPKCNTIVICAAIARMQDCYLNHASSERVNIKAANFLAEYFVSRKTHIIFLSTNQVFDGIKSRHKTNSQKSPKSIYGSQKTKAENNLISRCCGSLSLIRLTKVLSISMNLIDSWSSDLYQDKTISAFDDMYLSPVSLGDTAESIIYCIKNKRFGLFQLSGQNDINYFDFAKKISTFLNKNKNLILKNYVDKNRLSELQPLHTSLDTVSSVKDLNFRLKFASKIIKEICFI